MEKSQRAGSDQKPARVSKKSDRAPEVSLRGPTSASIINPITEVKVQNSWRPDRRFPILLIALALTGCPQRAATDQPVSPLLRVSQALAVSSAVTAESATAIIELNSQGVLTKEQTALLLDVVERVAKGGIDATQTVRKLNALSDADRKKIALVVSPMLAAVNEALAQQVVSLGEAAREKVKTVLVALQTALVSVQTVLEVTS